MATFVLSSRNVAIEQLEPSPACHLLRYLFKSRVTSDDNSINRLVLGDDDKLLTNYHIKTVMMWLCETQPADWWSASKTSSVA